MRSRHQPKKLDDDVIGNNNNKIAEATNTLLHKAEAKLFLLWDELPEWSQDNEFIHSGFRPISNSYWDCFRSCFYVHNETGNILSHLLATLWMIALPIYFYPYAKEHYPSANSDDWTLFGLFFLGGALCFALSTSYHALSNHSHTVHDFCHRLDFLGIIVVTAGCFPPGLWYTFPCAARNTKIFLIGVCELLVWNFSYAEFSGGGLRMTPPLCSSTSPPSLWR